MPPAERQPQKVSPLVGTIETGKRLRTGPAGFVEQFCWSKRGNPLNQTSKVEIHQKQFSLAAGFVVAPRQKEKYFYRWNVTVFDEHLASSWLLPVVDMFGNYERSRHVLFWANRSSFPFCQHWKVSGARSVRVRTRCAWGLFRLFWCWPIVTQDMYKSNGLALKRESDKRRGQLLVENVLGQTNRESPQCSRWMLNLSQRRFSKHVSSFSDGPQLIVIGS